MISIITIAKNEQEKIERTLLSVINQSAYSDIEYIVIDGASSDCTLEIINKYKDNITKIISQDDTGIYNAFNKGIKNAKGEWILFLNAGDTLFDNDCIKSIYKHLNCTNVVFGDIVTIDENGRKGAFRYDTLDDFELFYKSLPHSSTFVRREMFDKIGLFDETNKIVSDWQWFLEYFKQGGSYKYIRHKISIFYLDGISSRNDTHTLRKKERKKVLDMYYSSYKQLLYKLILKLPRYGFILKPIRKMLAFFGIVKIFENCTN